MVGSLIDLEHDVYDAFELRGFHHFKKLIIVWKRDTILYKVEGSLENSSTILHTKVMTQGLVKSIKLLGIKDFVG